MDTASGTAAFIRLFLFAALAAFALFYLAVFVSAVLRRRREHAPDATPTGLGLATGFVTNFFDTLGIGSYATTTSIWRALRIVPDEKIPGTLTVGHTIPTVIQAFLFIGIVPVDATTLVLMILAAITGSWLGAGVVSRWPRRAIQLGMGVCLLGLALVLGAQAAKILPPGGEPIGVTGTKLAIAVLVNFGLGALMTLGIGLYAPCLVLISLLGMNVRSAFPIMMGSCAFLMPVASARFVRSGRFDLKAALGLVVGGIPAVLIAFYIVRTLPLDLLRWVVIGVVVLTGGSLIRTAQRERAAAGGVLPTASPGD